MNNEIRKTLESSFVEEMTEFSEKTDQKERITNLKIASVVLKMLKEDGDAKLDSMNREERNLIERKKLTLDRSRLNFEKKKFAIDHEMEEAKLALAIKQFELERDRIDFERNKQKEAKNQARLETFAKIGIAVLSLVPAVLSFVGGMFALKLEYHDMGRTPSAFKDFMRNVKN